MSFQNRQSFIWIICSLLVLVTSPSLAGTVSYGDFGPDYPPGITIYQDVEESSGTDPVPPSRYGAPTLDGDTLEFEPHEFVAVAVGGNGDVTDGQLNFGVKILEVNNVVAGGLTSLLISEAGDYTLWGAGTAITSVAAGLSARIDILEVDGNPITPIGAFASNSIVRDLVSDGPVLLAPWNNGLLIEFGPILVANNIAFDFGVTKAKVVINDQLIAKSELASLDFIAKKDFVIEPGIGINQDFNVPEPYSVVQLAALIAVVLGCRRPCGIA